MLIQYNTDLPNFHLKQHTFILFTPAKSHLLLAEVLPEQHLTDVFAVRSCFTLCGKIIKVKWEKRKRQIFKFTHSSIHKLRDQFKMKFSGFTIYRYVFE